MIKKYKREDIPHMYLEEKLSMREIGERFGLTIGAVGSLLKVRGVKSRTPAQAIKVKFPNGRFGKDAANWKGGRRIANDQGYIYLYKPNHPNATKDGYILEHRFILEQKLGRYLKPEEIAHHINGIKTDNRPENIGLAESKSMHVKLHFDALKEITRLRKILDTNKIPY